MNIQKLLISALFSTLFIVTLHAQENEQISCSESYNICMNKCEDSENTSESCFDKCEEQYDKCEDAETTQPEE